MLGQQCQKVREADGASDAWVELNNCVCLYNSELKAWETLYI